MTSKEAIKQTAKDRDMNKRDVYHVIPCKLNAYDIEGK